MRGYGPRYESHAGGCALADLTADRTGDIGVLAEDLAQAALALARRFNGGATMWCLAPEWPDHARHLAVEFVHPVIVGKRALPAVSVPCGNEVSLLRAVVRPGDIVVAVAEHADPLVRDVVRRAPLWGATTVWIGAGPRPPVGAAAHVLWRDDAGITAPRDGSLVLVYHLLWELTHVCFEHPGVLDTTESSCDTGHCITCSDEGRLAEVVAVDESGLAHVRTEQGDETIDATIVEPVSAGDLLLVHAGAAIAVVDGDRP